ncbi:hypothetical protein [Leadbettera azotonutricia]|uniref:Uncharacterized protein n=1 Tax=Leadbettera azotonutricia (strain ATCC BAA-888 / DSM 13862 / ZAS-9) TaxID=545695 RepID=F5Y8K1_LEAAZ|nr:hypothetical protein [Leadbettera azotonutricia]AEF82599.1 conserved hypothetical protein [Leadbettera azotonutricia ZAS-9]
MTEHEFSYEIYLSCTQDVCIVGRMDNDFICAPSFSTVSDLKRTQGVIEKIANGASTLVSPVFSEYDEIKRNWYKLNLSQTRQNGTLLYHLSENAGGCFDRSLFADQIKEIFETLSKTGMARLAGNTYLPVLRYYHEFLKKYTIGESQAVDNCHQLKAIISIIESESYLKLSSDSVIRNLYQSIAKCVSDEIERTVEDELQTAKARLADGTYLPVLRSYHALLSKYDRYSQQAVEYYYQMKPLIGIIESESYLYSSSDSVVNDLYKSLARSASELYSAHMGTRG